jgi:hypothetical protein
MHPIELALSVLLCLQFLVVTLHDWLNIPGYTHGRQVQATVGRRKFLLATGINSIFPGIAVAFVFLYSTGPKPAYVTTYWFLYCAVTVASAIAMWYIPYFVGASQTLKDEYTAMYAGTRHLLPARGDNPRPNLLHLGFHALFLTTLTLACFVRFSR